MSLRTTSTTERIMTNELQMLEYEIRRRDPDVQGIEFIQQGDISIATVWRRGSGRESVSFPSGTVPSIEMFQNRGRSSYEREMMRYGPFGGRGFGSAYMDDYMMPSPSRITPEPEPKKKTEEEIKSDFIAMMSVDFGKKKLGYLDQLQHEEKLGTLEEFEKTKPKQDPKAKTPPPKRLCGICFDPWCPWSD